jgi:hypothetical protein
VIRFRALHPRLVSCPSAARKALRHQRALALGSCPELPEDTVPVSPDFAG